MVSSSNAGDDSNKLNGCLLKWKPRKVSAVRSFPPRCGRSVVMKSGGNSASENVDLETCGDRNVDIRNAVLPGCDGISETGLMEVEIGSFEAGVKTFATGKDMGSGGINISGVGVDSQSCESGTSHVGGIMTGLIDVPFEVLTESAYCVENRVIETGSWEMKLRDKVDGQRDEATSDSFEGGTKVEGVDLMLKEFNKMDGLASGHNSQMEVKSVLGGASADKILLPGPSHLLSSTHETIKPEYSMSDRIKFHHNKVCAVRDFPPTLRMNVSLTKNFGVERKATVSCRSEAVIDNSIKEARGINEKNSVVSSPDSNDKVRSRENNFSAGKESHTEVVHGLMAAPHCPWRNGEVSIYNVDSGQKMKQPKRKYVPVTYSSPKQCSEGRSKKRAYRDWLDPEGSSGSSTFLKSEDYVAFTEQPARVTPISMFAPDLDHLPGKGCKLKSSHSAFRSAYEDLKSGTIFTLKKTELVSSNSIVQRGGLEVQKNNPFWKNKSKAAARKTIYSEKNSGNKAKDDFSSDSLFSGKIKDFDVRLPRLGPKYRNCGDARSRVRDTLMYFHCICRKLVQKEGLECRSKLSGKKLTRPDLAALNMIKDEGKTVNTGKQILGEAPGVEVGDEFQYRAELAVVGMHRHLQAGIDTMEHEGVPVAISIVASGSYNDDTEHADVLIYSGQGGNIVGKNKNYEDQKLERGNLALSNSMKKRTPVRVVRGWRETVKGTDPFDSKLKLVSIYYYDGLYTVKRYWTEMGSHGKLVYKFELARNSGQPELAWKELKKACKSKVREGVCIRDISHGKESFPICAVNVLDDEKPPKFTYISKMMYPDWYCSTPPKGCDCVGRCNDSKKCGCAKRNGGDIPYNRNGAIVEAKPTVYECGPHCKCPPACYNRVTQRGIKVRLEIFKTKRRGWGLRASTSIPSGTFICEYAGELLEDKEAEKRIGNDEYLFDIGQNCVDSSLNYRGIEIAEEDGYTIDACHYGNLGRFINHSCSPNLYGQNVIYDHDDDKMPHVMLFAVENIPPFKELTYHYNYKVNQVLDSNGNVKIKKCFCGSSDCSGRMY